MLYDENYWMQKAIALAEQAAQHNEVPVGAIVVLNDEIIGQGFNQPIRSCDPTAHAEIIALRDAAKNIGNYRLVGATLYVTLEPCTMCVGAMIHGRIDRLVFGAVEPKSGAVLSQSKLLSAPYFNHEISVESGILAEECGTLLSDFFSRRRREKADMKNKQANK